MAKAAGIATKVSNKNEISWFANGQNKYQAPVFEHAEPRIGVAKEQGTQINAVSAVPIVYLSDLNPIFAIEGWYGQLPLRRDTSVDGLPIRINGVIYTKGLGAHSYSEYVYELNQGYTTFLSDIGIDDEVDGA